MVKLLVCGARGPGFDSWSRHYEFGDWLFPSRNMAEISLKRRKSSIQQQTTKQYIIVVLLQATLYLNTKPNHTVCLMFCDCDTFCTSSQECWSTSNVTLHLHFAVLWVIMEDVASQAGDSYSWTPLTFSLNEPCMSTIVCVTVTVNRL